MAKTNSVSYNPFGTNKNSTDVRKRPRCIIKQREITDSRLKRIKDWNTMYRRNLPLFVKHYFQIKTLHNYQKIMLYEIGTKTEETICASRATAKSWTIGLASICIGTLYPKSEIIVVSLTKDQASVIIGKIQDFYNEYPNIQREISKIVVNDNNRVVEFRNLSKIQVVALSDGARGKRATFIIREECNSIRKKSLLDSVISPMKYIRPAPFRNLPQYKHIIEEAKMVSISSAGLKQNWWYEYTLTQIWLRCFGDKSGLQKKEDIGFLTFDYITSLEHRIKTPKEIAADKKAFDYITFTTEYENIPYGISENAFFTYEAFDSCRTLKNAFYPKRPEEVAAKKQFKTMPRVAGEKRIVSADLATSAAKGSDNTAIILCRLIPTKTKGYERHIVYVEVHNGSGAPAQALRIRQLMTDFDADMLVMDMRNIGTPIFQIMTDVVKDEERGCEYPPITVAFHETIANKYDEYMSQTISQNAIPCIYPIHATAELNSMMSTSFRDKLKTGMIKMLVQPEEAEKMFYKEIGFKFYSDDIIEYGGRPWLLSPYEQTNQLINEALSLAVYVVGGNFKLVEPKKSTKDRIISLIYLNYYATLLDNELLKGEDDTEIMYFVKQMNSKNSNRQSHLFNIFR